MSTLTIRIPEDKHKRLRALADKRGMSLNSLADELFTTVLAQHDAEARFHARSATGAPSRLIELLDKLDDKFQKKSKTKVGGKD
jgi:hypothetical protein